LVLDQINLEVERGEKIAFVGKNGEGKTTLSKIIAGFTTHDGKCELGHNVALGFFAQHQHDMLDPQKTFLETIEDAAPDEIRPKARGILGAFLFSDDDVYKRISVLSGGEKARVSLAKLMLQPYNLLVMDEPTNHLDMISKDILKHAIKHYSGALIIVSHDREFLDGLTEKVYEFRNQKIHEHLGDINYFLERREIGHLDDLSLGSDKKEANKGKAPSENKLSYEERKERDRKLRKLKNAISKKEKEITRLEEQLREMEEVIHQPDFYQNAENPQAQFEVYNKLKKQLEKTEDAWTELQLEMEAREGVE
jgi:ATP-binding cassette subfamily F protein 3